MLSELMTSAKRPAPKKPLSDDDILHSLLREDEEPESDKEDESVRRAPESEDLAGRAKPEAKRRGTGEKKPSFVKRAWRFFWPFGKKDGGYLTPVTICGEILLDGNVSNDAPIEVVLFFADQNMRVTLQLLDEETEYFFSGNFGGEEPPRVSLRVQKKGYFPTKISRIKLHHSEDGFHAELNPIELLSREI